MSHRYFCCGCPWCNLASSSPADGLQLPLVIVVLAQLRAEHATAGELPHVPAGVKQGELMSVGQETYRQSQLNFPHICIYMTFPYIFRTTHSQLYFMSHLQSILSPAQSYYQNAHLSSGQNPLWSSVRWSCCSAEQQAQEPCEQQHDRCRRAGTEDLHRNTAHWLSSKSSVTKQQHTHSKDRKQPCSILIIELDIIRINVQSC